MPIRILCSLLFLTGLAAQGHAKVIADVNGSLKKIASIGDALDSPDHHPVHILYVHGINQVGAGDSSLLRTSICTRLRLCEPSDWKNAGAEFADKGEFADGVAPPALEYLGNPVWSNQDEWRASAPFVVHWAVHLRRHPALLVVDEINWWPLLLAIKCRHIIAPETNLAGPDPALLRVCSEPGAQDPGGNGRFYPWIAAGQAAKLAAVRPRGMLINRNLKVNLVDWGLSDVLMAVGPMGGLLRDGIRQLMAKSAAFDPDEADKSTSRAAGAGNGKYNWRAQLVDDNALDREFIGVTHSLGSYLLFNALSDAAGSAVPQELASVESARLAAEQSAMRYIFERTSLMYFFANQLEILEIADLEIAPSETSGAFHSRGFVAPPASTAPAANFRSLVRRWQQYQSQFQAAMHPSGEAARQKIQVVAWSDPSDVLTYRVPRIGDVEVVNLYVQNAAHWFGLFESPAKAHVNYASNISVLRVMFLNSAHSGTKH